MGSYRFLLEHDRANQSMKFTAQMYVGAEHGWVEIDEWTVPAPTRITAKARVSLVDQACAEHGWAVLTSSRELGAEQRHVIPVRPIAWRQVLTAATERRRRAQSAFTAADLAWKFIIADTPHKPGEDGYVGAIDIAQTVGLTRHRIYQILGVGDKDGVTVPTPE